jgi:hypothetical protein
MSLSPTPDTAADSAFVCDYKDWARSACAGEAFYQEHEGKRYCVLHYPGKEKSAAFAGALKRKLDAQDYNFRGVWFPDKLDFSKFEFNAEVDFSSATFSAVAYFRAATFRAGVYFRSATFRAEANFIAATFRAVAYFRAATFNAKADLLFATFSAGAYFNYATFRAGADFGSATFRALADFYSATFNAEANLGSATFGAQVRFAGDVERRVFVKQSSLNFQFASIAKPEQVSFHTLTLRPHWFVNMDARKFEFTNVDWDWRDTNEEVEGLKRNKVSLPHRMLAIACRQLAVNAEENNRYEEASRFRFMAMDARRLKWQEKLEGNFFKAQSKALGKALTKTSVRLGRSLRRRRAAQGRTRIRFKRFLRVYWKDFDLLHWLYWAASGYGEKITRAFVLLMMIWIFFAALYTLTGHIRVHRATDVLGAVNYSLNVMALQKPEPKSVAGLTPLLITFETILGPVQAALLALAIRRKFMR